MTDLKADVPLRGLTDATPLDKSVEDAPYRIQGARSFSNPPFTRTCVGTLGATGVEVGVGVGVSPLELAELESGVGEGDSLEELEDGAELEIVDMMVDDGDSTTELEADDDIETDETSEDDDKDVACVELPMAEVLETVKVKPTSEGDGVKQVNTSGTKVTSSKYSFASGPTLLQEKATVMKDVVASAIAGTSRLYCEYAVPG